MTRRTDNHDKEVRKFQRKLAAHPRYADILRKGATTYITELAALSSIDERTRAYKALLAPLVKDERLLDILSTQGHRLAPYLAYTITAEGTDNRGGKGTLITTKDVGRHSIESLYMTYYMRNATTFRNGAFIGSDKRQELANRLGLPADAVHVTGGTVTRVTVSMTFRR